MLSQVKDNYLYTLQNVEFAVSDARAEEWLGRLGPDGRFDDLRYDQNVRYPWSFNAHLHRLAALAAKEEVVQDPAKWKLVLAGIDFFLAEPRINDNWWYIQIGLPIAAGRLLLLLPQADLTEARKGGLTARLEEGSLILHPEFYKPWRGANLLWGVETTLIHGLLTENEDGIRTALQAAQSQLVLQQGPAKDGIQSDYSFTFHGSQFYSGGYGRSFVWQFALLIYALRESEWQFSHEALNVLGYFIAFGLRYAVRNKTLDYLTLGREIARPGALSAESLRKALLLLLKVPEMPCRDVMQEMLASFSAEGYARHGDKYFEQVCYYVSRSTTSHIACRGTSPALMLGETINDENMLSANLCAGGATCIMMDGKEYEDIFPVWDYAHIPGTTAPEESGEEILEKIPLWHGVNGQNAYCGGVSHNRYGVLYQDLNFGGVTGVTARFFVDGMMIALGADLRCAGDKPLVTTLNQCWQYGPILTPQDGLPAHSVFQGRVAYASLDGQPIHTQSEQRRQRWQRVCRFSRGESGGTVCTFTISHAPEGGHYAYAVIPSVGENTAGEQIRAITEQITVLQNDSAVQAVRYQDKLFCVFHQSGTFSIGPYDKLVSTGPAAHILDLKK